MATETGLDYLRAKGTVVDCDTLDEEIVKYLGPFQDCTSNQAIAYTELSKPENGEILRASLRDLRTLSLRFPGSDIWELAVDVAMVCLALRIAPHITGFVHIQTDPDYAYSTEQTIANALRIVHIVHYLAPDFDTARLCIKIPSTWEGLMACKVLEMAGVKTLATTLFTLPQAVLAAEVGCTYIAPYVNRLKVHFEPGFKDPEPLVPLCVLIQSYYEAINSKTKVLAASLTSVDEVFALAGINHITIAPGLLAELATPVPDIPEYPRTSAQFDCVRPRLAPNELSCPNDEAGFREAFARAGDGLGVEKLDEALEIFSDMQRKIVRLFAEHC